MRFVFGVFDPTAMSLHYRVISAPLMLSAFRAAASLKRSPSMDFRQFSRAASCLEDPRASPVKNRNQTKRSALRSLKAIPKSQNFWNYWERHPNSVVSLRTLDRQCESDEPQRGSWWLAVWASELSLIRQRNSSKAADTVTVCVLIYI